jgi:tetratricopeptide (TPR) repeat protein
MIFGNKIIFLKVPKSLKDEIKRQKHDHTHEHAPEETFSIDESIPIPVELPEGAENFESENLGLEMILAAMLRVIRDPGGSGADKTKPGWIDYYRRFVLAVKPEILNELGGASLIKAKNGDFDDALEIISLMEGLLPFSPGILLNKALILEFKTDAEERRGRQDGEDPYRGALDAYEKVLALEPVLPDALFNAGFFFIKQENYRRALDCFSRYLPLAGNGDKKKKAQALLNDIEKRGLDDPAFREALDLLRTGDDEGGLYKIKEFIERRSSAWNGWFVLGWALRKLGRWKEGLDSFRKAAELKGASKSGGLAEGNIEIKNETAICLMELGDYSSAKKELESALREDPENVKIISNLGVLAMKTGDSGKAAAFFRTVLDLDPEDPVAKEFITGD